jgi:hypothetical protein
MKKRIGHTSTLISTVVFSAFMQYGCTEDAKDSTGGSGSSGGSGGGGDFSSTQGGQSGHVGGASGETTGTGGSGIAKGGSSGASVGGASVVSTTSVSNPYTDPKDGVSAGNPAGNCPIPDVAGLDAVSSPTRVVGDGTPSSCTSNAVVQSVWNDGAPVNRVTFNCGADPIVITLSETIRIPNAPSGASTVIDGGGKVTLSGGGKTRILYANACNSELGWYTSHCQDQDSPHVTVQNLTFVDGNAATIVESDVDEPSGGAIFMRSGRLKVVNCRFFNNRAISSASDFGGGAIRVLGQYNSEPVYVVNSTFGGKADYGNQAANGGAISSIGTSWTIINSLFSYNSAVGVGANSGNGGNGGAIYNDGNLFALSLCGVRMEQNVANEGGGAVFFVSNNETGSITIDRSVLTQNTSKKFETLPGMFIIAKTNDPTIIASTVE